MESIKIPLVPQWNLISSCTSTPNDGFLYIGSKCINYVSKIFPYNNKVDCSPEVKVFHTRQQVKGIDCDPDWSNEKYFAAHVGDNSVQIWDFDKGKAKFGHKAHIRHIQCEGDGPPSENVRMCFLKNRTVLSVDSTFLVILCIASNTYIKKKRIIPVKHDISIIKGSPFDENTIAAGSKRGLILIFNIKTESILFTLRGHDTEITSLSWNGIGCNRPETLQLSTKLSEETLSSKPTFKTATNATPKNSAFKNNLQKNNDDIFDIYDYEYLENEFGAPPKTVYQSDDEFVIKNDIKSDTDFTGNEHFDFAEACQSLKEDIIALKNNSSIDNNIENFNNAVQVDLNDCKSAIDALGGKHDSISTESNDGSMNLLDHSSEESSLVFNQEFVHKVDVHHSKNNICDDKKIDLEKIGQPKDIYLASGSHESEVWIWDTKSGSSVDKIHLKNSSQNCFIEVCWLNQDSLLTNTKTGDLILWEKKLDVKKKKIIFKQSTRVFSHRGVVSLCKLKNSETIWTISYFREITCENVTENKILAKFSCASTNIAAIKERPDDMNKVAFACADRRIGILNISNISFNNVYIENCANKIESAVMSLSWSSSDSFLAFGTMEGRIGVLDTEKPTNVPINFNPFCGKPIYCVQWQENYIYACGNKKIAVYTHNKKNKDPVILEKINDASTLSLHQNFLLVGNNSGTIDLFRKDQHSQFIKFEQIDSKNLSSKYVSEISWSPIRTTHCAVVSLTNKLWILSLTNDGTFKLEKTYLQGENASGNASVKWSNKNENLLVTCGFDGAVRIWDVSCPKTDGCIFLKQFISPMLCGIFSPIDENVIICAGKATSIEMFNIKTEKGSEFSKSMLKKNKDKPFADVQWATKMVVSNFNNNQVRKKTRKQHSVQCNAMSTFQDFEIKEVRTMIEKIDLKSKEEQHTDSSSCGALFLKNHSTILHLVAKESNKDALENLMRVLQNSKEINDVKIKKLLSQKLFGNRDEVKELLDDELRNHQNSGTKSIANLLIPQISGDLKEEIVKCIQNKKIAEWHVSLAPTISYDFWKKCCYAYAHQLLEYGLILQASTYFLACRDVTEVIDQFLNGNYYREAWMICKIYKESDDPTLENILMRWINYLEMNGHFEGAALICALSKQYEKCRDILNKRQRPTGEHSKILDFLNNKIKEDKTN